MYRMKSNEKRIEGSECIEFSFICAKSPDDEIGSRMFQLVPMRAANSRSGHCVMPFREHGSAALTEFLWLWDRLVSYRPMEDERGSFSQAWELWRRVRPTQLSLRFYTGGGSGADLAILGAGKLRTLCLAPATKPLRTATVSSEEACRNPARCLFCNQHPMSLQHLFTWPLLCTVLCYFLRTYSTTKN